MQSESQIMHGASAAAGAPAGRAEGLRGLGCGRQRSLNACPARTWSFAFALHLNGIISSIFFPVLRQTKEFSLWHLDQCEHLPALGSQGVICWPRNLECTPEPHAIHP